MIIQKIKIPFWLVILFITGAYLQLFPVKNVYITSDAATYLQHGLYISQGHEPTGRTAMLPRRILPMFLAISFKIFGASVKSALIVIRLFLVCNILMIYFFGAGLYNRWAGINSALLFLFSASITGWYSQILVDPILPVFLLASLLFSYNALKKENYIYFFLDSLALCGSYLTKGMYIFFPVPFLLFIFIKKFRTKRNLIGLGILCILLILPLFVILGMKKGLSVISPLTWIRHTVIQVFLTPFSSTLNSGGFEIPSIISKYSIAIFRIYKIYLARFFNFAPLLAVSYVYILIRAFKKKKEEDITLLIALVLYLPVLVYLEEKGMENRHLLTFYMLSYMALSVTLWALWNFIRKKYILGLITVCLVTVQMRDNIPVLLKEKLGGVNLLGITKEIGIDGEFNVYSKDAGEWIQKNLSSGERILYLREWLVAIEFYTFLKVDFIAMKEHSIIPGQKTEEKIGKILRIWPSGNLMRIEAPLEIISEDTLLKQLKTDKIGYVMVTYRQMSIAHYFEESPYFEKSAEFNFDKIRIYKVKGIRPYRNFKTQIGGAFPEYLVKMRREFPERYLWLKRYILQDNFSEEEMKQIFRKKYPVVDISSVMYRYLPGDFDIYRDFSKPENHIIELNGKWIQYYGRGAINTYYFEANFIQSPIPYGYHIGVMENGKKLKELYDPGSNKEKGVFFTRGAPGYLYISPRDGSNPNFNGKEYIFKVVNN